MMQSTCSIPRNTSPATAKLLTEGGERILSIDSIRGLAIIMMVFSHGLHWFYAGGSHSIVSLFGANSVGDMATPFFYTISGAALYLSITSRLRRAHDFSTVFYFYLKRFSQLFLIGVFLSKAWGVLQAQAVSLFIIAAIFLRAKKFLSLKKSVTCIVITGLLMLIGHYILIGPPGTKPRLDILGDTFPLLAIAGLNALGFCLGYYLKAKGVGPWLLMVGVPLIVAGLFIHRYFQPIRRINMSISFIMFGVGMAMLLMYVFALRRVKTTALMRILANVGKGSLFLFVSHYTIIFVPLYLTGLLETFNKPVAIILSSLLVFTIVRLATWYRHKKFFTVYGLMDKAFAGIVSNVQRLLKGAPSIFAACWLYITDRYFNDKAGAGHSISEG